MTESLEPRFSPSGVLPVVIQDARTGAVLTLAYANREALDLTLRTRETHLFSRSRNALWRKGETSGNVQRVVEVALDCDGDALLYRVEPHGPACHTGATSCFATRLDASDADADADAPSAGGGELARALVHLQRTFAARRGASPESSYVAKLLSGGVDRIGKKIGEEATEVVIAAKNDDPGELRWEAADLLFHLLVLLEAQGVTPDEIGAELLRRAK